MSNVASKKISLKVLWPLFVVVLGIVGYFVYQSMTSTTEVVLDDSNNAYVSQTQVGKYIDTLNKENFTFTTNLDNSILSGAKDFSITIPTSTNIGRQNPFLP